MDSERERFDESKDKIERKARHNARVRVYSFFVFVLAWWVTDWLATRNTSHSVYSDAIWSCVLLAFMVASFAGYTWFDELRARMRRMDVMLREIQLTIPMIVPHRSVSMHEYLSERAAWKTTDRLDGRTDDGIEMEYTPESHDLVVKGIKCLEIGEDYDHGRSVPEDKDLAEAWYRKAVSWYELAARKGDSYAQEKLGDFYSEGRGVPRDHLKALNWWCEAANRGRASAQYKLAEMYYLGRDIQKDFCKAYFWFEIIITSHGAGFVEMKRLAAQRREYAAKMMRPDELSYVQARVRHWVGARC